MAIRFRDADATTKDWATGVVTPRPTYPGAVLGTFHRTERVMSDVWEDLPYAVVWDGTKVAHVWAPAADVDATPAVRAAALDWAKADAGAKWLASYHAALDKRVADAARPAKGKTVVVARGRKVPKGTTGTVIWTGPGKAYSFAAAKWGVPDRAGVKDAAGTVHWTSVSNLDVVDPDDYLDLPADYPPSADTVAARGAAAVADTVARLTTGYDARWRASDPDFWMVGAAAVPAAA